MQRRAPYHLLIGGSWKHLESVAPAVAITPDRPTSLLKSQGNVVWAQVADVVKRVWGFSFEWDDAESSRHLDYAAANPADDAWLFDLNLARINMLAASQTKGRSTTKIDVDGYSMSAFTAGAGFVTMVRLDQIYHLSYTTTQPEGAPVGRWSVDGATWAQFLAPPGAGPRRGSVAIRSTGDDLAVTWTAADKTTAARLTEGSVDDYGFLESRGATPCQVLVGDVAATYKMAWQDRQSLADSSYVLTEVG